MSNIFGGIMRGRNSHGMVYFIHLETKEKVLVIPVSNQKIQLIQDELTKRDLMHATELQKNGEISIDVLNELQSTFDMQFGAEKGEETDRYERITKYMDKQKSYIDIIFAIHKYYMPHVKEIMYSFYNGDEIEKHTVKYES